MAAGKPRGISVQPHITIHLVVPRTFDMMPFLQIYRPLPIDQLYTLQIRSYSHHGASTCPTTPEATERPDHTRLGNQEAESALVGALQQITKTREKSDAIDVMVRG